jgi:hypothetical protein
MISPPLVGDDHLSLFFKFSPPLRGGVGGGCNLPSFTEQLRYLRSEIGDDDVRAGALDGRQRL